jgi:hypothetical protein
MFIVNFYQQHTADAILITIVLLILIALIVTGKVSALRKAALYAITVAEEEWEQRKFGEIKKAQVITYLRTTFPVITAFIPDKLLVSFIDGMVVVAKEIWKKAKEALEDKTDNT